MSKKKRQRRQNGGQKLWIKGDSVEDQWSIFGISAHWSVKRSKALTSALIICFLVSDVLFRGQLSPSEPGPPSSSKLSILLSEHTSEHTRSPCRGEPSVCCLRCVRSVIVTCSRVGSLAAKVGGMFAGQHWLPRSSCSSWEPYGNEQWSCDAAPAQSEH